MTDVILKKGLIAFVAGDFGRRGLIVIHQWWGLDEQIKEITSKFSRAANMVAIAPDLYRGKVTDDAKEAEHLFNGLDWKGAVKDILIVRDFLLSKGVNEISVLGFCMGGALSLVTACEPGFHSVPSRDLANPKDIKCPLQLHRAGLDESKGFSDPETFDALENELRLFNKKFESYNYAEAKHAFMSEKKESFHESSASQAFKHVIEFLKK